MQLDDISKKIKQSAILRLDWFGFENILINSFGTNKGTQIADNILTEILGELSLGNKKEKVTTDLNNEFLMMGVKAELGEFIATIEEKCKAEIDACSHCRELKTIGLSEDEIYNSYLKQSLLSLSIPSDVVQQDIQNRLLPQIIKSGIARFDFAAFTKRAIKKTPEYTEQHLIVLFNHIIAISADLVLQVNYFEEFEEFLRTNHFEELVESDKIIEILKVILKTDSFPSWLKDLVNISLENCQSEKYALVAMIIGLCKKMSVDELEQVINIRLNH